MIHPRHQTPENESQPKHSLKHNTFLAKNDILIPGIHVTETQRSFIISGSIADAKYELLLSLGNKRVPFNPHTMWDGTLFRKYWRGT